MGLLAVIISSCTSPRYLPFSDKIDVNPYGSFIKIDRKTDIIITGELITIDSNTIVVLTKSENKCITVLIKDVERFKLRYAKPKHYGWTMPLGIVLPFIHGVYSLLTLPLHLIVTISVTASGESAFQYSAKDMNYDKLKMFARFPQGIPKNIDIAKIK